MEDHALLRLSQSQLNLLATCPRKFQQTYLDQLASPMTPEQQEKQSWGSRFHLLMQQWNLGLPVERVMQEEPRLQQWFTAFVSAASTILTLESGAATASQSEHCRTLKFQDCLLTVVYDLLLSNAQQAQILDWKTYPRPQNQKSLEHHWQTRLYLFVLAETSAYPPEQISMVYWFFQTGGNQASDSASDSVNASTKASTNEPAPQPVKIAYNTTKHEQTRRELTQLLNQLKHWLTRYEAGEPFPQVELAASHCQSCNFVWLCDRLHPSGESSAPLPWPALANIQEIPL